MSDLITLFQTPIYISEFPRDFSDLEKASYGKVIDDNRANKKNLISKDTNVLNKEGFSDIREFIQVHINQYTYHILETSRKQQFYITTSWMNLTKPGMSHHLHSHPNSIISGVFYFETIPNDTLIFKNPNRTILKSFQMDMSRKTKYNYLADQVGVNVKNKNLLLFPSDLEHEVFVNESEVERISLSFNTFVKGTLDDGVNKLII